MARGAKPIGDRAMTSVERQARFRAMHPQISMDVEPEGIAVAIIAGLYRSETDTEAVVAKGKRIYEALGFHLGLTRREPA
jgi:hypothetical protein